MKLPFPAGLGETDSIVNLDEDIGKWTGRRTVGPPQEVYARLLRQGRSLSGGKTPFPRGVFRFKSHEQADAWNQTHILKAAMKK